MSEIKCPTCGAVFKVDESGMAGIIKQVRDKEFKKEIEERERNFETDKSQSITIAVQEVKNTFQTELATKEQTNLELKGKLEVAEAKEKLAVSDATSNLEMKIHDLKIQLSLKDQAIADEVQRKTDAIEQLNKEMKTQDLQKQYETEKLIGDIKTERNKLQSDIDVKNKEIELSEKTLKEQHEFELRQKDEQIAYYKDLKAKQSTKMVGETLEQHCLNEFNRLRSTAFKNAYFEKDNEVVEGSKGDFIYRENDENGNELVSILFDMKTELDETATKKRNDDFLDKLDKDRNAKKCEYAVLVSLLELDNDFYNSGIADVSFRHDKMYVVRPQSFISMITLLRDSALRSKAYIAELALIKSQNVDITNFEKDMQDFRDSFGRNYRLASERFADAINNIDKSIEQLQKVRDNLLLSDKNLRIANQKAEDLSIKKLTRSNPTMKAKFNEIREINGDDSID